MRHNKPKESVKSSKIENKQLWQAAIKWPLYSVAIMPVFLAGGWSYAESQNFRWGQFFGFLFAAILLLIWENLTNDIFDADTGVDQFKFHSVVALLGQRQLVKRLAYLALGLGLLLIFFLGARSNPYVLPLVIGSCCLGYIYQGPPFRLGYQGLGEPLCWLAFGPFATSAALLAISPNSQYQNGIPWSVAGLIGTGPALATTLVLFCSHFHQTVQDAAHGKKTSLVRLGTYRASRLIPWFIILILLFEILPIFSGKLPLATLLGLIALPSGIKLIHLLKKHHNNPKLISESKFLALRFQTLNGFGISLGFALTPHLENTINNLF